MLTSFDRTFDFTFARVPDTTTVPLPPVGGDGSGSARLGGTITGAVMPFARPNLLGVSPFSQGWEKAGTVTTTLPDFLPPWAILLPRPDEITDTPWCVDEGVVLEAATGRSIDTFSTDITRLVSADTLFMIAPTGKYELGSGELLLPGRYQLQVGDPATDYRVSDVFEVVANPCDVYRIVLDNPTPIGQLPYGKAGFQQVFYVPGELLGPTYEETETKTGSDVTGGTTTKVWTFAIANASEALLDALSLVRFHRLVEVDTLRSDGTVARPIQAMAYQAKFKASQNDSGNFDIELTLPVSVTSWGSAAAGCAPGSETDELQPISC